MSEQRMPEPENLYEKAYTDDGKVFMCCGETLTADSLYGRRIGFDEGAKAQRKLLKGWVKLPSEPPMQELELSWYSGSFTSIEKVSAFRYGVAAYHRWLQEEK